MPGDAIHFERVDRAVLLPGAKISAVGRRVAWRGYIRSEQNFEAYVKLCPPRELIAELLCVTLARGLRLPVPKAFLVQVLPNLTPDSPIAKPALGVGSEQVAYPDCRVRIRSDEEALRNDLRRWPALAACAAFDIWVCIEDRYPGNLLYGGGDSFTLIDFEAALAPYLSAKTRTKGELVELASAGRTEEGKLILRRSMLAELGAIAGIDWPALKAAIPFDAITSGDEMLEKMSQFLDERSRYLPMLIGDAMGLKQLELVYHAENVDRSARQ